MEPLKLSGHRAADFVGAADGPAWAAALDRIGVEVGFLRGMLAGPHRVDVLNGAREDAGFDTTADTDDVLATLATLDALLAAWRHVESVAYRD